jgi:hypothetical protein
MSELKVPSHSHFPTELSFKKKILRRIIASVRYYLDLKEIDKAEAGLITALNFVGFISQDIIEVIQIKVSIKYNCI